MSLIKIEEAVHAADIYIMMQCVFVCNEKWALS